MSLNLMAILNELANIKQLDKEKIREIIIESLQQAIIKKLKPENELEIIADFGMNDVVAKYYRIVAEDASLTASNSMGFMSLVEAKQYLRNPQIGDRVEILLPISKFEPKVIKIAREDIAKKIKKLEQDRRKFDFDKQKNQIVVGKIKKNDYNGYLIDIGFADALLPVEEQIEDEFYKIGDIIRSYVLNIRTRNNDLTVILSRAHPEFVKKLFEAEVPEIGSGDIEIKKIIREPGIRTKVAVLSKDKNLDAAGCCLGPKGMRLEQVKKELHGEQIDIVVWDESPEQLIANAIGADLIEKVYIAERGKFARVIVSDKNKNLAIGKQGKNVKLAAKLTDYKLDIYTDTEFEEKIAEERRITSHVSELDGVNPKLADVLKEHGYTSVQDIFEASVEELCNLENVGYKTALKIKDAAKYF